jgi:hydroxyethylthiazole kinase-like sugar kinase family protein
VKFAFLIKRAIFCVIFVREGRIILNNIGIIAQSMTENLQIFINIWTKKNMPLVLQAAACIIWNQRDVWQMD